MNTNGNATGSKPLVDSLPPLLIAIVEDKGGVGKSTIADALHAGLTQGGLRVGMIDIDGSNSVGVMQHEDAIFGDTSDAGWQAKISIAVRAMATGKGMHVLILDSGARDEYHVRAELEDFNEKMSAFGGRILVVRPLTTSRFTHANAAKFAQDTAETNIAVVTMEVQAQGRTEKNFTRWRASDACRKAKEAGAEMTHIESFGIEFIDDAVACRLSVGDIARENFDKKTAHPKAREVFGEEGVVWAQDIVKKHMRRWLPVFHAALAKRGR